ncbi:chromosome-associated kinesin KIF4B, partial [Tanacetum coccineum]
FGPSKNRILKDDNGAKKGLCELAIEELFDLMKTDHDYITWSVEFEMDLAGSKKIDVPTKESTSINSGLHYLDLVIEALSKNQQHIHIPYNNHTLTRSLEASLEGKSKVVVLAPVSGPEKFLNKTMNMLRFANKTRKVQNGVIETLDKDLRTIQKGFSSICEVVAAFGPKAILQREM